MASNLFNLALQAARDIRDALARKFGRTQGMRLVPEPRRSHVRPGRSPMSARARAQQELQELVGQLAPRPRPMTEVEEDEDQNEPWMAVGGRRVGRRTTIDRVDGDRVRVDSDDPLYTGEMIEVTSSNVHSIGFILDGAQQSQPHQGNVLHNRSGTLLIRFLDSAEGGVRSGPGPLYEYKDVPATLFVQFQSAASKGTFVWDHIRVRGTVTGHRYSYDFAGSPSGYVPRQAAIRRGQNGQHFLRRTFNGQRSQLGNHQVSQAGPNPQAGARRGQVRGAGQGTNRGGVGGLRFGRGGRSR